MKHEFEDSELQEISDKIKQLLEVKYKNELGDIPDHVKNSICQNYVFQLQNNRADLDKLLDEHNIALE